MHPLYRIMTTVYFELVPNWAGLFLIAYDVDVGEPMVCRIKIARVSVAP